MHKDLATCAKVNTFLGEVCRGGHKTTLVSGRMRARYACAQNVRSCERVGRPPRSFRERDSRENRISVLRKADDIRR